MRVREQETGLRFAFRALRHRDFALFWSAALVSNSGSWMQNVTVPFVLYRATRSTAWVGFAGFAQFLPALLLGPVGGVLADRFSRRSVTLAANVVGVTGATGLAVAWRDGHASPWTTVAWVSLVGVVTGIGLPAWQSLGPSLVPRDLLQNAVTLNSAGFNASRAIGPALGGLVLSRWGASTAFTLNAVSFVAVVAAIAATRDRPLASVGASLAVAGAVGVSGGADAGDPAPATSGSGQGPVQQFRSGLAYALGHRGVLLGTGLVLAVAFFGSPVIQFATVFARDEFGVGRTAYGLLTSALGAGAVITAVMLAAYGDGVARSKQASVAIVAYALAIVVFALAPWYGLGLVAMLAVGAGYLATVNALNTSIQLLVDDEYRGRVLSLYAMALTGGFPFGSLVQGWVASVIGVRATVAGAGLLLLGVAVWVVARPGLVDYLDDHELRDVLPGPSTLPDDEAP